MASPDAQSALLRWRLVLGDDPSGAGPLWQEAEAALKADLSLAGLDRALGFLYGEERSAGLGGSSPYLPTWLGDIRRYFPQSVVSFMEKDAIERKGLKQLLMEPETLQHLERDVGLVATILSFKPLMPEQTRQTARQVVGEIAAELKKRLENKVRQTFHGAMRRDQHSPLRVLRNLDLRRTVQASLKHYQPEIGKVIPERVYFFANQRRYHEWRIIILVDQSGSMAESVVYSSIIAAVFATVSALDTRLVYFDTGIGDMSEHLSDPVDLLFGAQLGGGTDIARAVAYGSSLVTQPDKTIFLLITDLYEGGSADSLLRQLAALKESRVHVLNVLALNDAGKASYNVDLARKVASLGIPAFAATPDRLIEAVERAMKGGAGDAPAP